MAVLVQQACFDEAALYTALVTQSPGAAVVTFAGYVRDLSASGRVTALELEHYPGMTEKVLVELGERAASRFKLQGWHIVHRYGVLAQSEPIVWVGVVADHREPAFEACHYIMDVLKTDAPFWKREHLESGEARWVESRQQDITRREAWDTGA